MKSLLMQRYESIVFSRDGKRLLEALAEPAVTGLRVWQEGKAVIEVHAGHWDGGDAGDLGRKLAEAGVELEAVFDVELFRKGDSAGAAAAAGPVFYRWAAESGGTRVVDLRDTRRFSGDGATVFLCLNGPSFDGRARDLLANRPGVVTFCVNNGAHAFRPDLWTCVDAPERFMRSIWVDGRIAKFVPAEFFGREKSRAEPRRRRGELGDVSKGASSGTGSRLLDPDSRLVSPESFPQVLGYRRNEAFGAADFLTEPTFNWGNHKSRGGGRSVMLVTLKIAYVLGFRRVVLVGCDFEMSAEKRYWFPEGRTKLAIKNNMTTYGILEGYFTELLPVFTAAGFSVVNATPGSRLTVFPSVDLATEVAAASIDVSGSTEGMY